MRNQPVAYRMWTAVLGLLFCLPAISQTVTGDIGGTVADSTGAVVVGAEATATNVGTGVVTSAVTNKDGIYSIRFLPVGT